jgi:peptidoglycan/LPS O-acetylase OafA/YrhL
MRTEIPSTLVTTNTLKGIAISAVLINHYLNLNISGDYKGFAYYFVSLFFLLSGYGLYHSLDRRFADNAFNFRDVWMFYILRGIRIFPLLWTAWVIQFFVTSGKFLFWVLLGVHGQDHLWFIPALLQCYVVSPFIYLSIKKYPNPTGIIIVITLILINFLIEMQFVPGILMYIMNFTCSVYLKILIFIAGIYVAILFSAKRIKILKNANRHHKVIFFMFLLLTILAMVGLKYAGFNIPQELKIITDVIPIIMLIFLSAYAIRYSIKNSAFAFLGSISYSIYLFHWSFYLLPDRFGDFPKNSFEKMVLLTLLFPLFIFFCLYSEKLSDLLTNRFKLKFYADYRLQHNTHPASSGQS